MSKSKKVWITGGGSGIGRSIALALAHRGDTVVISGRNAEKLDDVVKEFEASNSGSGELFGLPFDVSREEQIEAITAKLSDKIDGLDIAILSAGVCEYVDNVELESSLFRRVFDANVFGVVNSTQVALPLMKVRQKNCSEKPHLVAISSISTYTGLPRASAYGASKAAVDYFCDSLSIDLGILGIDVSVIQPGFIDTPMTSQNDFPMPFQMSAEQAAQRIIKAIDSRKRLYRFPKRLLWLMRVPRSIPFIWYRFVAPAMVKNTGRR